MVDNLFPIVARKLKDMWQVTVLRRFHFGMRLARRELYSSCTEENAEEHPLQKMPKSQTTQFNCSHARAGERQNGL